MSYTAKHGRPHPLQQIAENPTHKLLLKQWLKEEELIARRIFLRESRLDAVRREVVFLCCAFFVLHSVILAVLFAAARGADSSACHRWWIPVLLSLASSLAMIWAIHYKLDTERHMDVMLEREAEDRRLLGKCVEELKKKGLEFDLLTEVDALRRAKSLKVEARGGGSAAAAVRKWSARDFATMFFFTSSCAALVLTRYVLCH